MELTDLIGELEGAACGLAGLSPAETLAHPAWMLPVEWAGEKAELRSDGTVPADALAVRVKFGTTPCVLSLAASEDLPELSALLPVRSAVPEAVLLAEVEKEAGPLLAALEDATRMEVAVDGLCEPAADATAFRVVCNGEDVVRFTLTVAPALLEALGDVRRLDTAHPSVAEAPLDCEIEYAKIDLSAEELAGLAAGDRILLPEMGGKKPGRLVLAGRGDAATLRVIDAEPARATVGAWLAAEGEIRRARTEPCRLRLVKGGKTLATGSLALLGEHPVMQVEAIGG